MRLSFKGESRGNDARCSKYVLESLKKLLEYFCAERANE